MNYIFRTIKKLFFWGYARNTWQYDVLCALILAFIFLTPQSWFDGGSPLKSRPGSEPTPNAEHQKPVASKVIFSVADNLAGSNGSKRDGESSARPDGSH